MTRSALKAVVLSLVAAAAPVAPTAPVAARAHVAPRAAEAGRFNHHLHGFVQVPGTGVVRGWYSRWDYYGWWSVHRGYGGVEGLVRGGEGHPVADADVRLRDAHDHGFRSAAAKHVTRTGSDGTFVMSHVRAGTYRVRATHGKHSSHTPVHVHAGQVAEVAVKV